MRKMILFVGLALLMAITPLQSASQDPVVTEAIINAPLAEVWQAFTTRDGIGDSRTKVTIHMLGFGNDDESQKMRAFFERGNKTTLDNLVKKYK